MPRRRDDSSDDESIETDVDEVLKDPGAVWGKAKYDYYYTDYIDKDYPNSLSVKEDKLARLEQEEALRIQKKLLSTLDNVNYQIAIPDDTEQELNHETDNLIDFIKQQNRSVLTASDDTEIKNKDSSKVKRVKFDELSNSDGCETESNDEVPEDSNEDFDDGEKRESEKRQRRPINMAIKKNRGLTPYKKKEYRNPRLKHRIKYKKALSKRRHLVKEAQTEYHRYSGETTGIKTSTIKSIKLC